MPPASPKWAAWCPARSPPFFLGHKAVDDLRIQLEYRQESLRGLSRPSPVLEWLLRDGTAMNPPLEPRSAAERRLVTLLSQSLRFRRAQCYANAQQAVLLASGLGAMVAGHTLQYCEGFAHLPMLAPFAHGWCLLNSRLWDPSLDHVGISIRYLGVAIPSHFIRENVARRRTYAPVLHLHLNGVGAAAVERTGRVGSAVDPRPDLAGAASRM